MQYFGYLRRNPNDPPESTLNYQGYNFWLNKLNSFGNDQNAEMVKAFIIASEYRQRFGRSSASARILGSFLFPIPQCVNFPRPGLKLVAAKDTVS